MDNQYSNFYFDPTRQGYDPLSWSSLFGTPTINGNQLSISDSTIIGLADILRGDATFNITTPTPVNGYDKTFGFIQYAKGAYINFRILDDTLTANTSDGVTAYSVNIPWSTSWSNVNTEFRIKWEAGQVQFFVGGSQQTIIGQSYLLDIPVSAIPSDPMSLYLSDYSSGNQILLNYISVKGIQSYVLNTGASTGTIINHPIQKLEKVTLSESITMLVPSMFVNNGIIPQNLSITESVTVGAPA